MIDKVIHKIKFRMELCVDTLFLYLTSIFPRNRRIMLFGAWWGNKYDDNSRYLFEYVVKEHSEISSYWISSNQKIVKQIKEAGYPVCFSKTWKAIWLSLRARYCIYSTGWYGEDCGHHLMKYMGNMQFIDLWHGVPLKKIMYDDDFASSILKSRKARFLKMIQYYPRRNHYHFSTSNAITDIYVSCFDTNRKHILCLGQARNDYFYTTHVNSIRSKYTDKMIILYMPTHRKNGKDTMNMSSFMDFKSLNNYCKKNNAIFLIKKHFYHVLEAPEGVDFSNIVDITRDNFSSQELLDAADILVTDFSSCYIDHLLLNRPQVFFSYDMDDYIATDRGLYENYTENVPGPICKDFEGLMSAIDRFINGIDDYEALRITKRDYYYSPENQCAVSKKQIEAILNL